VFGVSCNIHQVRGCRGSGCSGKYSTGQREVCLGFRPYQCCPEGVGVVLNIRARKGRFN